MGALGQNPETPCRARSQPFTGWILGPGECWRASRKRQSNLVAEAVGLAVEHSRGSGQWLLTQKSFSCCAVPKRTSEIPALIPDVSVFLTRYPFIFLLSPSSPSLLASCPLFHLANVRSHTHQGTYLFPPVKKPGGHRLGRYEGVCTGFPGLL